VAQPPPPAQDTITVTNKQWKQLADGTHQLTIGGEYTLANAAMLPSNVDVFRMTGANPVILNLWGRDNAPKWIGTQNKGTWTVTTTPLGAVPPLQTVRIRLIRAGGLIYEDDHNVSFP
jgi:hypothetical protein